MEQITYKEAMGLVPDSCPICGAGVRDMRVKLLNPDIVTAYGCLSMFTDNVEVGRLEFGQGSLCRLNEEQGYDAR